MKIWKRISVIVIVLFLMLLPMQVYAEQNSVHDQLRQELRTALWNHEPELNVEKYNMSPDEVTAVYRQLVTEEPGYWYVAKVCGYIGSGSITLSLQFYYFLDAQQTQQIRAVVQDVVDKYIHSGMSDVHKALALHDYLVMHNAYDTNYLNYDAYDALVWGSSVCQGYAEAYEILLDAVGIESEVVSSDAMNHAWNLVKIDGQWYHVDVTWDDPLHYSTLQDTPGYVSHDHFLCSDSQIQNLDHYGWETDIACTSTAYDGEMFWDESISAIWFLSDKEVLMRRDTVQTMEVFIKNLQTGTETSLYADMNKYFEYDGYWYYVCNRGLSVDNGTAYFGDLTKIYKLSDLSGTPEVVCTLADLAEGHYIYSSYVDGIVLRAVVVNQDTRTTQIITKLLEENHVHTWSDGVVTVEPTENSQGEICYTCSGCGEVYRQILEKTEHVHSYRRMTIMPTCTTGGYTRFTCDCGYSYEGDHVAALGHNWQDATCDKPSICTRCNASSGRPAGHRYDNNVDGTCNGCGVHRENVETREVVHMFRMYNPNTGEHFYTGSTVERDNLIVAGWHYEGVGFTFPANTGDPVHRLFQPSTGEHLYTMDVAEKDRLMAQGWNYEGIAFNSAYDTEAVQHRLHNPNAKVGAYHFTFSEEEKQNLIAAGWEYQGIGWYSCWK